MRIYINSLTHAYTNTPTEHVWSLLLCALALEREIQRRKLLQTDLFILFKTRINIVLTFFMWADFIIKN